ncbi:MAG: hemin uptake protein HemP [Gammaproteobacteria bacterium]
MAETAQPTPAGRTPRITSSELLRGAKELIIEHAGEQYRLRLTRAGKLILTK